MTRRKQSKASTILTFCYVILIVVAVIGSVVYFTNVENSLGLDFGIFEKTESVELDKEVISF